MCHVNEECCKNWREIDFSVQNWHEQFDWFKYSKISKMCTLMGCLWSKYIMFDLRKYKGVMFDSTEYWCKIWRKTDFCFQKWHKEFGKFSPETWKSQNLDFDGILLNPKYKIYELKTYRGVVCHDNKEWCKTGRGIDLLFQNWDEEFDEFWLEYSKISKRSL